MASSVGVDSFQFLRSSLTKRNVLVVGDGNFSFSLSLVIFRDELGQKTSLILTSFDCSDVLKRDEFTRANLERLQGCENVEVMHNIDATKLSKYFSTRKFGRIIFNFPHTGGKSNIKKCRKLLEDFFMSAVEHVDVHDGDICVTLCKGQGGTPGDEPQRAYGNSWQIINNAAKAGLILHELYHFLDSSYSHYKSVGYRGKLTKSFHTTGGLIHIFIPGVKLAPMEDLSGESADTTFSHVCKLYDNIKNTSACFAAGHPLHLVRNEILNVLNSVTAKSGSSFEEILENSDVEDVHQDSETSNGDCLLRCGGNINNLVTYNERILSAMKKSSSFVLTDDALTISGEITSESNISMRYLAIGRFFDTENNVEKVDSERQKIIDELKRLFSIEKDYVHEVYSEMTVTDIDSKISTWTNSSDVAHLARKKCHLKRKTEAEQSTDCSRAKCCCQTLCREYLRKDSRIGPTQRIPIDFFDQDTQKIFKTCSSVVIICGRINQDVLKMTGHRYGWLVLINLDALAMIQYKLSDIRILSSNHVKWEGKSTVTKQVVLDLIPDYSRAITGKYRSISNLLIYFLTSPNRLATTKEDDGLDESTMIVPVPTNMFPPEHVHDISFWISDDVSQELFFLTTVALTKNCVKEIRLTEIYHDEDRHWLCFNYRMIYSRVDGPLSHLEAVGLQNRLRRALIVLGFGLK